MYNFEIMPIQSDNDVIMSINHWRFFLQTLYEIIRLVLDRDMSFHRFAVDFSESVR